MSVRTRSQSKQHSLPWKLPGEVLAEIWKYVLFTTPHHDTHIRFEDCASWFISHCSVKAESVQSDISHDLFRRKECPDILLVNKQIYNSARPFLSHNASFTICTEACLLKFMELVPKDIIHTSTTFYCRIREENYSKETFDGIRRIVAREYGEDVNVVFKRQNTTSTWIFTTRRM